MSGDELDQRSQLLQLKLSRLVEGTLGLTGLERGGFPSGAALFDASAAWVYLDAATVRSMGSLLMWALNKGDLSLNVLMEDREVAEILARRALGFVPPPAVNVIDGATLSSARVAAFAPVPAAPSQRCRDLSRHFVEHGLEVVEEWGVLRGEIAGLEVARIVEEPEPHIETGVGDFDREISLMMRSEQTTDEALESVSSILRQYRRMGAPPHPIRDLVSERWRRAVATENPAAVDAVDLTPVDLSIPRTDLRSNVPAAALGRDRDLVPTLYLFTSGLDVDLVPTATDTAAFHTAMGQSVERITLVGSEDSFPPAQRRVVDAANVGIEILTRPPPHLG